jgi:hypothetical protein
MTSGLDGQTLSFIYAGVIIALSAAIWWLLDLAQEPEKDRVSRSWRNRND